MIKLIASDIDGTLVKEGSHEINPAYYDVIRELKEAGITFCACSGRQYQSMLKLFRPVADDIYFITSNGTMVRTTERVLHSWKIDPDLYLPIIERLRTIEGSEIVVEGPDVSWIEGFDTPVTRLMRDQYRYAVENVADLAAIPTDNIIKISPDYRPEPIERKQVFGITFEQGRNEIDLSSPALFENIPTQNKAFTPEARRDLMIALITLKYTQSNSVCYVKDGQAIGIGAGQQSRIHCTRLAGNKADIWWLRQHEKVMNLPFKTDIRRADRDNTIDIYISDDSDDVLADGQWQQFFTHQPEPLTREEKREWIAQNSKVALGSDAFFPFGDNIERAHKSGVESQWHSRE